MIDKKNIYIILIHIIKQDKKMLNFKKVFLNYKKFNLLNCLIIKKIIII